MIEFAKQLKKYRREHQLSQEQLAEQLFISRQAISKWEQGDGLPDLNNIVKLAEIFDISLDELVLGKSTELVSEENTKSTTPQTFLEFLGGYWWIIFPILIILAVIKSLILF